MFKIDPQLRLSAPKFQKIFFCIFVNIFIFLRENKEVSFVGISVSNGQIRITVLNYTVALSHTWTLNLYMSASYLNSDYYQVHFFFKSLPRRNPLHSVWKNESIVQSSIQNQSSWANLPVHFDQCKRTVVHFFYSSYKNMPKSHKCRFCGQIFISHQELSIHRRNSHQGQIITKKHTCHRDILNCARRTRRTRMR